MLTEGGSEKKDRKEEEEGGRGRRKRKKRREERGREREKESLVDEQKKKLFFFPPLGDMSLSLPPSLDSSTLFLSSPPLPPSPLPPFQTAHDNIISQKQTNL